jgi:hypothetical protein
MEEDDDRVQYARRPTRAVERGGTGHTAAMRVASGARRTDTSGNPSQPHRQFADFRLICVTAT